MNQKPLLNPRRLRRVPPQFSWIDQRLVRAGHLQRTDPESLALYLFLVTVGDKSGVSYYSDPTAAALLKLSLEAFDRARRTLLAAELIAYRKPYYQVLSLDPAPPPSPPETTSRGPAQADAEGEPQSAQVILEQLMARVASYRKQTESSDTTSDPVDTK